MATASAAVAFNNGYDDGEKVPFDLLLRGLRGIVEMVSVPVTADVESGYAMDNAQLEKNMKRLLGTGVMGINFEDIDKKTHKMLPIDVQCEKIRLLRQMATEMGVLVFINAPTDLYLRDDPPHNEGENLSRPQ